VSDINAQLTIQAINREEMTAYYLRFLLGTLCLLWGNIGNAHALEGRWWHILVRSSAHWRVKVYLGTGCRYLLPSLPIQARIVAPKCGCQLTRSHSEPVVGPYKMAYLTERRVGQKLQFYQMKYSQKLFCFIW